MVRLDPRNVSTKRYLVKIKQHVDEKRQISVISLVGLIFVYASSFGSFGFTTLVLLGFAFYNGYKLITTQKEQEEILNTAQRLGYMNEEGERTFSEV